MKKRKNASFEQVVHFHWLIHCVYNTPLRTSLVFDRTEFRGGVLCCNNKYNCLHIRKILVPNGSLFGRVPLS